MDFWRWILYGAATLLAFRTLMQLMAAHRQKLEAERQSEADAAQTTSPKPPAPAESSNEAA